VTADICGRLLLMRGLKNLLGGQGVDVIRIWEQNMRLSESHSESLILMFNWDMVEFEANMVLLIQFQVSK